MAVTHWYEDIPAQSAGAPVLAVLPGMNSGAYLFHPLPAALGHRYRVLLFNPPGVAGAPLPQPFSAAAYARVVLAALDELGIGELMVLGHSLGGFAAQELARLAPIRVRRLILVGSSPGQPFTAKDLAAFRHRSGKTVWQLFQLIASAPEEGLLALFGPEFPRHQPQAFRAFVAERERRLPEKSVSVAHAGAGGAFSSLRWIAGLTMPALVLHGGADVLISPASGRALALRLPAARYLEFPGCGHFPMLEHPEFYPALATFLAGGNVGEVLKPPPPLWQRLWQGWSGARG